MVREAMTIMKYDACPNKKLFFFRKFTMLHRMSGNDRNMLRKYR